MTSFRSRHPGPWSVEVTVGGHYAITSSTGTALAYVYVERDTSKTNPTGLPPDEALALANAIAKLGGEP